MPDDGLSGVFNFHSSSVRGCPRACLLFFSFTFSLIPNIIKDNNKGIPEGYHRDWLLSQAVDMCYENYSAFFLTSVNRFSLHFFFFFILFSFIFFLCVSYFHSLFSYFLSFSSSTSFGLMFGIVFVSHLILRSCLLKICYETSFTTIKLWP